MKRSLEIIFIAAILASCSLAPEYNRPEVKLPDRFVVEDAVRVTFADSPWWTFFSDPVLKDLIAQALDNNKDLLASAARIEQARAQLGVVRADLYPGVNLSGSAARQDFSDNQVGFLTGIRNTYSLLADLNYQLDFWGRYRNASDAARYQMLASEQGYNNLRISLLSEVARTYFLILDLQYQKEIANRTHVNRQDATKVIEARFKEGILPELDFNQAQIEEAEAALTVISTERGMNLARNALALLLGKSGLNDAQGNKLEFIVPDYAINYAKDQDFIFSAATLQQRPDVQAAELMAKAALKNIGVARAEQLPNFSLTGSIGYTSLKSSNLFEKPSLTWNIAGQFVGPLIDFGRSDSVIELAQAQSKETLLNYEGALLQAVKEVEDAITEIRSFKAESDQRYIQVVAARNASKLSRDRYNNGFTSYLEVLDIERSLFVSELAVSNTRQQYFSSIVKLYQALGGGWGKSEKVEPAIEVKVL